MTVIYMGRPVPLNGQRVLSSKEAAQRAMAMKCVRSKSTECQGQVFVGLFFDGTGNNDTWVEEGQTQTQRARNKHSNVARLFDAHVADPESGIYRYYIPGVGTPFKEINDTAEWEYDRLGMGFGFKGADRINYGITPPRQNSCRLHRSTPGAAMKDGLGSIRTDIQRQSGGAVAAAGERSDRRGCARGWDRRRHLGALARGCAVQARPRAGLDRCRPA